MTPETKRKLAVMDAGSIIEYQPVRDMWGFNELLTKSTKVAESLLIAESELSTCRAALEAMEIEVETQRALKESWENRHNSKASEAKRYREALGKIVNVSFVAENGQSVMWEIANEALADPAARPACETCGGSKEVAADWRMITEYELIEIAQRRRKLEDAMESVDLLITAAIQESEYCPPGYDRLKDLREDLETFSEACRDDMNRLCDEIRKSAETGG